jgi:hypothetical protein
MCHPWVIARSHFPKSRSPRFNADAVGRGAILDGRTIVSACNEVSPFARRSEVPDRLESIFTQIKEAF